MFCCRKSIFILISATCSFTACVTPSEPEPVTPQVIAKTVINPDELGQLSREAIQKMSAQKEVMISLDLVEARKVARARVELREGPGAAYYLEDEILTENQLVIVLDRYFRWRKVLVTDRGVTGWVHEQTLSDTTESSGSVKVSLNSLTALFTASNMKRVLDYETSKKVSLTVPKGSRFYKLKKVKNKYLILMEDTMSIAWVYEGDVI